MLSRVYKFAQTERVIRYITSEYGVECEFLWPERFPTDAVFRNPQSRKWFGIIMTISGARLGLETEKDVEIIDLKFDKGQALDFAESTADIFPGYHMNKRNWITIVLDDTVDDAEIFRLIDKSFTLSSFGVNF